MTLKLLCCWPEISKLTKSIVKMETVNETISSDNILLFVQSTPIHSFNLAQSSQLQNNDSIVQLRKVQGLFH